MKFESIIIIEMPINDAEEKLRNSLFIPARPKIPNPRTNLIPTKTNRRTKKKNFHSRSKSRPKMRPNGNRASLEASFKTLLFSVKKLKLFTKIN